LPSQYEALGLVYFEAMACGCPVVATGAGGGPEAVMDGETGIVVRPLDAGEVVQALDLLLGDESLRHRMGTAGRRRIEQNFTMEHYIRRVLTTYEKTIEVSLQKLHGSREGTLATEGSPK